MVTLHSCFILFIDFFSSNKLKVAIQFDTSVTEHKDSQNLNTQDTDICYTLLNKSFVHNRY